LIEQAKAHSRELRKTDRELVRDRHKLEAEEQRIVNFYFNLNQIFIFDFIFRLMKFEKMHRLEIKK